MDLYEETMMSLLFFLNVVEILLVERKIKKCQ